MQKKIDIPQEYFNKSYSDSITDGFSLFKKTYFKILPIFVLILITFLIISNLVMIDPNWQLLELNLQLTQMLENIDYETASIEELQEIMNFMLPILLFSFLLLSVELFFSNFPQFLAFGIVGGYLYKTYLKQEVNSTEEFKRSMKVEILLIPLLFALLISLGLLLLFIPALIIYIFFIFSPVMHSIESEEKLMCIKASRRYSKNNLLKIIGLLFINLIITGIVSFIYTLILDLIIPATEYNAAFHPATRNYLMIIIYTLIYNFANILLSPLLSCLLITLLVYSKKQMYNRDSRLQYYQRTPQQQIPLPSSTPYEIPRQPFPKRKIHPEITDSESPIFCPYCGFSMERHFNFRFCPSCGEKIPKTGM